MSGRRHGRCARPLRVLDACLSSGALGRDSVHLVPGVSHQRGGTTRDALYLELGDGLGGGRGGLRSHAQNAHLVHAAGPRSARSRALSPASSRAVPALVTTSSRGRDRARSSCCTRRNTYSGSGSNRRPRVVVMKADFERALLEQATEASGTRVVVDVRAPKDAVAARGSRWIDARGRRRGQVSGIS